MQETTTHQAPTLPEPLEALVTRKEAARILGVTKDALVRMARENRGPAWVRVGGDLRGAVRYSPADLREYIAQQRHGGRPGARR